MVPLLQRLDEGESGGEVDLVSFGVSLEEKQGNQVAEGGYGEISSRVRYETEENIENLD